MSGVFPPPPSPPGECVPPAFGTGGGHTRWVERGQGANILENTRRSSVLCIFQYFVGVAKPRVLNSVPSSLERTLCVSKDLRSRISTSGSQRFFRMCRLMAVRLGASGACCVTIQLKVDGNENEGGQDEDRYSAIVCIVVIEGYFQFECAVFLNNSFFLFPVSTAL